MIKCEVKMCQGSEYVRNTQGSEYAWACSWIMLEYVWMTETKPTITVQAK